MLAILFILQLSILPSWGADTVLLDRLTSSEAEDLDIQIPADVPPGYHEVVIEVLRLTSSVQYRQNHLTRDDKQFRQPTCGVLQFLSILVDFGIRY